MDKKRSGKGIAIKMKGTKFMEQEKLAQKLYETYCRCIESGVESFDSWISISEKMKAPWREVARFVQGELR